jgi:hypothetical protein
VTVRPPTALAPCATSDRLPTDQPQSAALTNAEVSDRRADIAARLLLRLEEPTIQQQLHDAQVGKLRK